VTETTTAGSLRTELHADVTAGRRGVSRPLGRLTVDNHELAVRSALTRWIPARSVSKNAVGDISVVKRTEIHLPILRWRQVEVVRFDPASPFADVSIKLSPRKRIADVLRARGYSVIDQRA
jgi:hypothetical protein